MQEYVRFAVSDMGAEDWVQHAANSFTEGLNEASTRSHRSFTSQKLSNIGNPLAPNQDNTQNRQFLVDSALAASSLFEQSLRQTLPQGGFDPSDESARGQANAGIVRMGWNTVMRPAFNLLLLSYMEAFKAVAYQWTMDTPDNGCTFDDLWNGPSEQCSLSFDGYKNVIDEWYTHMVDARGFAIKRRMESLGFTNEQQVGTSTCAVLVGRTVRSITCNPGRWEHQIRDNLNKNDDALDRLDRGGCASSGSLSCSSAPSWYATNSDNAINVKNAELQRDMEQYYRFEDEEALYNVFEESARGIFDAIYNDPQQYVQEVEIQRMCYNNPSHVDCIRPSEIEV
ncbi:MAG: hypothetical protein SGILL_010526 [Bacillariaceae sp.]